MGLGFRVWSSGPKGSVYLYLEVHRAILKLYLYLYLTQ